MTEQERVLETLTMEQVAILAQALGVKHLSAIPEVGLSFHNRYIAAVGSPKAVEAERMVQAGLLETLGPGSGSLQPFWVTFRGHQALLDHVKTPLTVAVLIEQLSQLNPQDTVYVEVAAAGGGFELVALRAIRSVCRREARMNGGKTDHAVVIGQAGGVAPIGTNDRRNETEEAAGERIS